MYQVSKQEIHIWGKKKKLSAPSPFFPSQTKTRQIKSQNTSLPLLAFVYPRWAIPNTKSYLFFLTRETNLRKLTFLPFPLKKFANSLLSFYTTIYSLRWSVVGVQWSSQSMAPAWCKGCLDVETRGWPRHGLKLSHAWSRSRRWWCQHLTWSNHAGLVKFLSGIGVSKSFGVVGCVLGASADDRWAGDT